MKDLPSLQPLQERIESLHQWLTTHKSLIAQTKNVKILLNVRGNKVIGEVTSYPEE